jgi:hypothetical protein
MDMTGWAVLVLALFIPVLSFCIVFVAGTDQVSVGLLDFHGGSNEF